MSKTTLTGTVEVHLPLKVEDISGEHIDNMMGILMDFLDGLTKKVLEAAPERMEMSPIVPVVIQQLVMDMMQFEGKNLLLGGNMLTAEEQVAYKKLLDMVEEVKRTRKTYLQTKASTSNTSNSPLH